MDMIATTGTRLSHAELVRHVRNRIKVAGLRGVGVRKLTFCGEDVVSVYPLGGADQRFTYEQQRTIRSIAAVNHLTYSQGMPIDVEQPDVHGSGFRFYTGYA